MPQYEVVEEGRWLARVDLAWPDARVVVEYDGEHHVEDGQIARDDARLARLTAAGWWVIRLAAPDLRRHGSAGQPLSSRVCIVSARTAARRPGSEDRSRP